MGPSGLSRPGPPRGATGGQPRQPLNLGAGVLIPGLTQLRWRQRDRGLVFLVSFVAALGTSLFCWGKPLGWALLGFAFVCHAAAMLDVLRQRSFPVFPPRIAASAMVVAMVLMVYLPLAAVLWLYALPTRADGECGAGYLVNCLAYQEQEPLPGQWIWFRAPARIRASVPARSWPSAGRRSNGRDIAGESTARISHALTQAHSPHYPEGWRFRVPEHHFLVGSEPSDPRVGAPLPSGHREP